MKKYLYLFTILSLIILPLYSVVATGISVPVDSLIKNSRSTIYYYAADGHRYVFPNTKTYKSWFGDFGDVVEVTDEELAQIPLRGNVTYRPGVRMVKIQSSPKVYAVGKGGKLKWVKTEALAEKFYGADWNQKIDDIPVTFFVNYDEDEPIEDEEEYDAETELSEAPTINQNRGIEESDSAPQGNTSVGGGGGGGATPQSAPQASPNISDVTIGTVSSSTAAISWYTNKFSDSEIRYSLLPLATATSEEISITKKDESVKDHSVNLTGLTASSTYYFKAMSTDKHDRTGESIEYIFETLLNGTSTSTPETPGGGSGGTPATPATPTDPDPEPEPEPEESTYCDDSDYTFCDDFESTTMDTDKWLSITGSAGDWIVEDGKLGRTKGITVPVFADFTYEIEASPAPLTSGAGPTFRYQDSENYYLFQIRPASAARPYGHIVPHIRRDATWTLHEPVWNEDITINSETWYTYKVIGDGNVFYFFINDVHIGTWTDENNYFPEGRIGWRPQFYSHGVQYDNIKIKDSITETLPTEPEPEPETEPDISDPAIVHIYPRAIKTQTAIECKSTSPMIILWGEAEEVAIEGGLIQDDANSDSHTVTHCSDGRDHAEPPLTGVTAETTYKYQVFQDGVPTTNIDTFTTWNLADHLPQFDITIPTISTSSARIEYTVDAVSQASSRIFYSTNPDNILSSSRVYLKNYIDEIDHHFCPNSFDYGGENKVTNCTIPDLIPGTTYYVQAVQYSYFIKDGIHDNYLAQSDVVSFTTLHSTPEFILSWGSEGTGDGEFHGGPYGIDVDSSGNVFVADGQYTQKFNSEGVFIAKSAFGIWGHGLAIDSHDNVYVVEESSHSIYKLNNNLELLDTWDLDPENLHLTISPYFRAWDIDFDSNDNLFVSYRFKVLKLDTAGNALTEWGSDARDGLEGVRFAEAVGVAVDSENNVYVSDITTHKIQVFDNNGNLLRTIGGAGDTVDGFRTPMALHFDSDDNMYVAEFYGNKIKKMTKEGVYLLEWGSTYGNPGSEPGELNAPRDVAVGSDGSVYVNDHSNYRVQKFR